MIQKPGAYASGFLLRSLVAYGTGLLLLLAAKLYLSPMLRYLIVFFSLLLLSACFTHKKSAKQGKAAKRDTTTHVARSEKARNSHRTTTNRRTAEADTATITKRDKARKSNKTAKRIKPKPVKKPKPFDYGQTREQVLANVTDRSELMVAEFNLPRGHLVTYQYTRYGKAGMKAPKYYLYFMNDTLIRKSEPEDPRKGSKRAIREYYYSDNDK
jgi:hypothetical protein